MFNYLETSYLLNIVLTTTKLPKTCGFVEVLTFTGDQWIECISLAILLLLLTILIPMEAVKVYLDFHKNP